MNVEESSEDAARPCVLAALLVLMCTRRSPALANQSPTHPPALTGRHRHVHQ